MSTIVISGNSLELVARAAENVSRKAQDYADALSRKVASKFDDVPGGGSEYLADASYMVQEKIKQLNRKTEAFSTYAKQVTQFAQTARRVDQEVRDAILNNQNTFMDKHGIKVPGWKAAIIEWLVNFKNSNAIFTIIGDIIQGIGDTVSDVLDQIRYWYKCEGGKEKMWIAFSVGAVIVSVLLFLAALPALSAITGVISGIVAIAGVIGGLIGVINAITNLCTSVAAYAAFQNGDYAWAKIHEGRDKLSDVFRAHNWGSAEANNLMNKIANGLDFVDTVCSVIAIADGIVKISSKLEFVKNYFNEGTGLRTYMKEARWVKAEMTDPLTGQTFKGMKIKVNDAGVVETKYTIRSIFNGMKAYVTDAPITDTGDGLRTMLNKNFKMDFKIWKDTFTLQGFKDTLRYNKTQFFASFKEVPRYYKVRNFKELKNLKNYADLINGNFKFAENTIGFIAEDIQPKDMSEIIGDFMKKNTVPGQLYDKSNQIMDKIDNIQDIFKETKIYSIKPWTPSAVIGGEPLGKISVNSNWPPKTITLNKIAPINVTRMTIAPVNLPKFPTAA